MATMFTGTHYVVSGRRLAVIEVSTAQDRLTRSVAERVFGTIGVLMFTVTQQFVSGSVVWSAWSHL